jgi:hypothetical protein
VNCGADALSSRTWPVAVFFFSLFLAFLLLLIYLKFTWHFTPKACLTPTSAKLARL